MEPHSDMPFSRREFVTALPVAILAAPGVVKAAEPTFLRAAVIGHTGRGDYGHGLEGIFQNRPGIELVALADPDDAGRKTIAAKIRAPRTYADYRMMLAKEKPRLVSVAMRHADLHHEIILTCLKAGAHVYAEKPFTRTPSEADELLAEADRRGLKIAVAHTLRLAPQMTRFRQALREGLIGDVLEMRAYGKQDARAGGEDLMVLGSHLMDLMRASAGDPVSCSARVLQQGRPITKEDARLVKDDVGLVAGDEVFATYVFPNGINASFSSSARLKETVGEWGIEVLGSKGAARINCDVPALVFVRRSGKWTPAGRNDEWTPLDAKDLRTVSETRMNPVTDWLDAIAKNREPECSGRNGAWAIEMVMAVYYSSLAGGAPVVFPLKVRTHPLAP